MTYNEYRATYMAHQGLAQHKYKLCEQPFLSEDEFVLAKDRYDELFSEICGKGHEAGEAVVREFGRLTRLLMMPEWERHQEITRLLEKADK